MAEEQRPKSTASNIADSASSKLVEKGLKKGMDTAAKAIVTNVARGAGTAAAGPVGTVVADGLSRAGIFAAKQIAKQRKKIAALAAGLMLLPGILLGGLVTAAGSGLAVLMSSAITAIVLIAFFLFVINSGAYIVPPGQPIGESQFVTETGDTIPVRPPPPGGRVSKCAREGKDITFFLSSRIQRATVQLLPVQTGYCIVPTMMIMHWSAGPNDDPAGNDRTYNTLVSRGLACQLATDTNDTWLMQPFYQDEVEMSWCAGYWNGYSINNEMAGVSFTANPPPPNTSELGLAYSATCEVMETYGIPWCQIYGHYQVPYNGGKTDPGRQFLQEVFIPEIKRRCPNDSENICSAEITGNR